MILCRIIYQVDVEPVYMWNNVRKNLLVKIINTNLYLIISGFEPWRLDINILMTFSKGDLPAQNWTGIWVFHLGKQWKYLGRLTWPGYFTGIIASCVPFTRRGTIYDIILTTTQGKRFSDLGRVLKLTFTWILSIHTLFFCVMIWDNWIPDSLGFFITSEEE